MKIGDEAVDAAKRPRRKNEDRGIRHVSGFSGYRRLMGGEEVLDRTHRRRPHGHAPSGQRRKQRALRGGGHFVAFPMDGVRLDGVGGDRFEGAQANVERDIRKLDAASFEPGEQLRGEMQARRGGGHGHLAVPVGVHRLIALEIPGAPCGGLGLGFVARDVRRKRNVTESICDCRDRLVAWRGEADGRRAIGVAGDDFTRECAGRVRERGADGQLSARLYQALPRARFSSRSEEEALDLTARGALGVQPGGQDGDVVAEKNISRMEELGQIGEREVLDAMGDPVDHQQSGLIAARDRGLRDQLRRENVIEKVGGERRHKGSRGRKRWSQQSDLNR
jgi:hypothetical protein